MTERPPPVFLERRTYRRRRAIDAIRVLPIFGTGLFLLPLLWPGAGHRGDADAMPMSDILIYIFAAWAVLILAIVALGRLERGLAGDEDDGPEGWPGTPSTPSRPVAAGLQSRPPTTGEGGAD
ncbi:hypothetical protein [Chachezhania sediminis]|uniref:hypothetical protein n=1 Tax=Chachezhania sediminis TaxID=2599291 RepID=UPI00131BDA98|nr:hypothetical protein [Chachezhania sediminis]